MTNNIISNFIKVANRFCDIIEKPKTTIPFLRDIYNILPELMISVSKLPVYARSNSFHAELEVNRYLLIKKRIYDKIRKYDTYLEIFDPYDFNDKEPVFASISDDLADIYRAIKPGLLIWDKQSDKLKKEIIVDWNIQFTIHWQEHLTGAIRAISYLLHDKIENKFGLPINHKGKFN